jgi:TatD DNase family protein
LPDPLPPFLNVHTHRKPSGADEFVIRNAFLRNPSSNLPCNYSLSFGIHPWFTKQSNEQEFDHLETIVQNKNCLAIGECGIDRSKGPNIEFQLDVFKIQIELANRLKKPMILHLVRSYSDILKISGSIKVPWLVHGFRGNEYEAHMLMSKGGRLSFGAALIHNDKLQSIVAKMPLDKLYLETDVSKERIQTIYAAAASIRKSPVDSLRKAIWINFERDFEFTYGQ